MKSISAPVLGDPLYYKESAALHDRAYLHAYGIRFDWKGERYQLVDQPKVGALFTTPNFKSTLEENFQAPWALDWPTLHRNKSSVN